MEPIYEYRIYLKNGQMLIVDARELRVTVNTTGIGKIHWRSPDYDDENTYTILEHIDPNEIAAITRRS